jgi:hypothetical protein
MVEIGNGSFWNRRGIYFQSQQGGLSTLDPHHNACDPDDHSPAPLPPLSETPPEEPTTVPAQQPGGNDWIPDDPVA